ncbi:MAG: hypothetical protein ACJ76I_11995 [Gaiellaceae bacterium]
MSYKVSEVVIEQSRSKHGSRTVALIIAETAHHDGVGWLRQEPSKSVHRKSSKPDERNIAFRTKLSAKQVRRCVDRLQELDELEVVWARDQGNRFYIYRLIVGPLRYADVDYERGLPFLEGRFWTAEELELPWRQRPLEGHALAPSQLAEIAPKLVEEPAVEVAETPDLGGQNVPSSLPAGERTFAPDPADISGRSAGGHPGPLLNDSSLDLVLNSSLDRIDRKEIDSVSAGADDGRSTDVRELVKAFAREFGFWPNGHAEWSTWCAAFKPLADQGVTAAELASRSRAYLERWQLRARERLNELNELNEQEGLDEGLVELEVGPDSPAFMFALTKHYQRISASLERSYFGLFRWATENSWRLANLEHARWVIEASERISVDERAKLLAIVEEAYRAHGDAKSEFLQWVEMKGWALGEDEWKRELAVRTNAERFRTQAPEMRRQGKERRLEIRKAFAHLDLGLRSDVA